METMDSPNTPTHMGKGGHHMMHGRHEHHRRARGGHTKVNEYNAVGAPEEHEAEDESPDFKKGGKAKRKAGGKAEGEHSRRRGDRMPRGKRHEEEREHRAAGGRTHHGHGGHHHDGHEHEVEHDGAHAHHHHGASGHVASHHGEGDIHIHRRRGGKAEEHREHERRARGGRMGGHSPYSSGRMLKTEEASSGPAAGHEGGQPAGSSGYD